MGLSDLPKLSKSPDFEVKRGKAAEEEPEDGQLNPRGSKGVGDPLEDMVSELSKKKK